MSSDIKLELGDCLEVLSTLDENSIDTCITDPPYELGFMGKKWDSTGIAFQPETWKAVFRVLKPGALLLAFGGTRTYHRMVCAIEDAGFEIRDTIAWVYGSGFPKNYDISKGMSAKQKIGTSQPQALRKARMGDNYKPTGQKDYKKGRAFENIPSDNYVDKLTPEAQLWNGWGTVLKPAFEPIVIAMKPLDGTYVNNALTWGVAGMWIDGGRIEANPKDYDITRKSRVRKNGVESKDYILAGGWKATENAIVDTQPTGRYPANFIHDGSEEVMELFPETGVSSGGRIGNKGSALNMMGTNFQAGDPGYGDSGSAARFFYCAKSSRRERNAGLEGMPEGNVQQYGSIRANRGNGYPEATTMQNTHPSVKPLKLMQYLARLTKTPTGGTVLDPFMGSGSTGCACVLEGRDFIGIELESEYFEIAKKRIEYYQRQAIES